MDENQQPQEAQITPEQPAPEQPAEVTQPQPEPAPTQEGQPAPVDPKQAFLDGYNKLSSETGYTFSVEPKFVKRDDNTYSLMIETSVMPKQ